MRCFLALGLPEPLKGALWQLQEAFKGSQADVKWVDRHHFHLTFCFFKKVEEEPLERWVRDLTITLKAFPPFRLELKGVGAFPTVDHPRVIWAGVVSTHPLNDLYREIRCSAEWDETIREENRKGLPWKPHVTLGRVRPEGKTGSLTAYLKKIGETALGSFPASDLVVMESRLDRKGPLYTERYQIRLK